MPREVVKLESMSVVVWLSSMRKLPAVVALTVILLLACPGRNSPALFQDEVNLPKLSLAMVWNGCLNTGVNLNINFYFDEISISYQIFAQHSSILVLFLGKNLEQDLLFYFDVLFLI